ncbi:MAG: hypothetical protein ACO3FE_00150, partial [Planctomycetaceae bacterium]
AGPGSAPGDAASNTDIIFGDHGAIVQNVADPKLPPILLQKKFTDRMRRHDPKFLLTHSVPLLNTSVTHLCHASLSRISVEKTLR